MKKSIRIILIISVIFILLILSYPEISHPKCVLGGGKWNVFPNTGVDDCFSTFPAGQAFTTGCDCGSNKCWDGNKCVPNLINNISKKDETQDTNNTNFLCNQDSDCILRMDEKVSCRICDDCKFHNSFDDPDIIAVNKTFNISCPPRPKEILCVACIGSIITPNYYLGHVKCINHICVKLI